MNKQQEPRLRFKGFTGEWKNKTLGDLGRVEMCRRIFKEQTQPSGEIPFFKIGTFGQEPDAFISSELFEEYRQKYPYPKQGDILISAAGTIGRTVEFTGENAYFQDSNIVWLRFDESQITSIFLNIIYQNIKWDLEGSTIKRLYNSDLLSAEITLPSLPEQTHLGLFFRCLDSQIAESRAVLEKSRQLKKAMLAKMFPANGEKIPKIRFKGFEGEWERKSLRDVLEIERKGKAQYQKLQAGNVPYLDAEFLNGGVKILTDAVPDVDVNDILIIWDGSNAGKVYTGFNGVLGSTLKSYRTNADCSSIFLYQELVRNEEVIFSQYRTPNIPHVIKNFSDEYNFLMPSYKEQTAIGLFFRQLDETIALQSAEVEKLNQLKKGLLAAMLV
ncbi:hypothetical protein HMPREF2633_08350 [Neisseria sp. HMSC072C05]|mgnify:CR=1 FL=1|jgi:type I restriction enzyme S subunit|uniref:restriction endonuclease subunit S n=1 Tax=Neisseria sp. HMSC072C05 TaxID=1715112 RepID=UPI0008A5B752|nr:restriction endonuclease subunit S [Neisseria sp. HMSC072C05]OFM97594.1 hypothetical protein HMPREF2633_08350 [Neisseria sp. HMSC072C05]